MEYLKRFEVLFRITDSNGDVRVCNTAPTLLDSQIEVAEREIGYKFPDDYRSFIFVYSDAGFLDCSSSRGPHPGCFYGMRDNSSTRLLSKWDLYKDYRPSIWVPVCDDVSNGGIVGLQLDGPQRGHVFVARFHDGEFENPIAETFAEFLLSFYLDDR